MRVCWIEAIRYESYEMPAEWSTRRLHDGGGCRLGGWRVADCQTVLELKEMSRENRLKTIATAVVLIKLCVTPPAVPRM